MSARVKTGGLVLFVVNPVGYDKYLLLFGFLVVLMYITIITGSYVFVFGGKYL